MRKIHNNLGITDHHFNVVVEELLTILEEFKVDVNMIGEVGELLETVRDDILCK